MPAPPASGRPVRVLVAPDSFKGTFSAPEVARAIGRGLESEGAEAELCPVADGGEGTMPALVAALGGSVLRATVSDPLGRPVEAELGLVEDGRTAVVECAAASGLHHLPAHPEPEHALRASSAGTGELLVVARDAGVSRILLGVGGSATTDGGRGAIEAIERAGGLHGVALEVICDVTTPFERAAEVFGPQKGADERTVEILSERLRDRARNFPHDPRGLAMTGCAGGLSGGLWAALGARLRPGASFVLDAQGFDARLDGVQAVISGEGRLDRQTAAGKIVAEIGRRCRTARRPLHAVVGQREMSSDAARALGIESVTEATSERELEAAGAVLGRALDHKALT